MEWFVYVLINDDRVACTGIAKDITRRFDQHNTGSGAKFTRGRDNWRIVHTEGPMKRGDAQRREMAIKRDAALKSKLKNVSAIPGECKLGWTRISEIFEEILSDLEPIQVLGPDDFNLFRLSRLTYGLIESPLLDKLNWGIAVCEAANADQSRHLAWEILAYELDFKSTSTRIPAPILSSLGPKIDHISVIRNAIKARHATNQFLISWGKIHELHARYLGLIAWSDEPTKLSRSAIVGMLNSSVEIQEYWYAHWLKVNALSFKATDRIDPGQQLGMLCRDIRDKKIKPWGPYPRDWYGRVLGKQDDDVGDNFKKIGSPKLEKMLLNQLITPQVLPPLTRDGFEPPR